MLNNFMAELECEMPEATLKLDRTHIPAGEEVTGSFLFWREIVERTDNAIDIEFVRRAQIHDEVIEQKLDQIRTNHFLVHEESQTVEIPFSYLLPQWLPVSTHAVRYYLRPRLSVESPCAPDRDEYAGLQALIIQPNAEQTRLIRWLTDLGFQEKLDSRSWNGIFQQFDFVASKRASVGVRNLSLLFQTDHEAVQMKLLIDQREPVRFSPHAEQDLQSFLMKALHA